MGVDKEYMEVLKRLYANQLGKTKVVSQTSRAFKTRRGAKQGDSLSTISFKEVRDKLQARFC